VRFVLLIGLPDTTAVVARTRRTAVERILSVLESITKRVRYMQRGIEEEFVG
jgi:hypothetical protein